MNRISVTVSEACHLIGIGRSSLYKIIGEGKLVPRKQGKRTLILVKDLDEYVNSLPAQPGEGR